MAIFHLAGGSFFVFFLLFFFPPSSLANKEFWVVRVPQLCTMPVLLSSLASQIGRGLCCSSNFDLISGQMVAAAAALSSHSWWLSV